MNSSHTPMLGVLLPLVLGVLFSDLCNVPFVLIITTLAAFLAAILYTQRGILLYPIIFCVGAIISDINDPATPLKPQEGATVTLRVSEGGKAEILSMRRAEGEWRHTHHLVILSSSEEFKHESLICKVDITPLESSANSYLRNLCRMGYEGRVDIKSVISHQPLESEPLSSRLNCWAMERLERLKLNEETFAAAASMGLARREFLSDEVREEYNLSGTAHLLSLSGLHLSIVVLLISIFTYLLPLGRNGHIIASVVTLLFVWLFAYMVGLSESVLRAAIMLSIIEFASLFTRQYASANALFTSAVVILIIDPHSLYDIGFQLSFLAVLAIILVGAPLCRRCATRNLIINFVVSSIIVGTAATVVTSPLISHSFGYISILGPLSTMPLLLTLTVIVIATLLWVIAPIGLLAPLFWWVIEISATLQNYMVHTFAQFESGYIFYRLSTLELAISYALLAALLVGARLNINSHHQLIRAIISKFSR